MKSIVVYAALVVVGCLGCRQPKPPAPPPMPADAATSYRFDSVRLLAPETELVLNGEVSFDQDSVAPVFPLVSGNVEGVQVALGAYVRQGQDLATIRSGDITNYLNDYRADQADLELAQKNLQNAEALYQSDFASETDYLAAKKAYQKAKEEAGRSAEILRIYGGGTIKDNQPFFTVKAPIAGYIVGRNVTPGMQLRPDHADPLFTISNLRKVWVLANVYESDILAVQAGQPVTVRVLAYPELEFKGKIDNVSSVLENESRVLKVRIVLDNAEGLLKPDMFATIHVHLPEKTGRMLAVPPKSVVFDQDRYFVVVQRGKDRYELRQVKVEKNTSRYVFVAGNLKPGEQVATEGSLLLYDDLTAAQ